MESGASWACSVWQGGCHCSAAGVGVERFVLSVMPGDLRTFWCVKGFSYILIGDHVSREVSQAPEVLLALPRQEGFAKEAGTCLYLVCWKSE